MKLFVAIACLVAVAVATETEWKDFKLNHGKSYRNSVEERLRFQIFQNNLKRIEEHNQRFEQGLETYEMGVNQFADMTAEEFLAFLKLSGPKPEEQGGEEYVAPLGAPLQASVDWRTKGAVTPVKDQKSCGSCWAFSATGALEGQDKLVNGRLLSLSEQNLVDCSRSYGNQGCNGGLMNSAFNYVRDRGINSEANYPYEARDGKCRFNSNQVVLRSRSFKNIARGSESSLQSALSTLGPVSVAIDATSNLQLYRSGIFTDRTCSANALNHGVLAVGYNDEAWIVKNSWGKSWGESGYVRFKRGSNLCGIATQASVPTL